MRKALSLDDYLAMSLDQECELVAGELRPKPTGTFHHSDVQLALAVMLYRVFGRARTKVEFSIRRGEEVLIPDVCVLRPGTPKLYRQVLDESPLLFVEIVSPSQRPGELFVKCEMYHEWGVEYCWVIDPVSKRAWNYHAGMGGAEETRDLLTGPADIPLAGILAE